MAGVKDEPEIPGGVGTNQRPTIDYPRQALESFGKLDVIDCRVNRRESAQELAWRHPSLESRELLRIKCFGMRHPSGHP